MLATINSLFVIALYYWTQLVLNLTVLVEPTMG